jgi:hypothetical protein
MGSPLLLSLFPDAWVISDIIIDHSHINFDACGATTHHTGHEKISYP